MERACDYCMERPSVGSIRIDRWSGMGRDLEFSYCSEEHRKAIKQAASRVRGGAPWFLAGMAMLAVFALVIVLVIAATDHYDVIPLLVLMVLASGGALLSAFPLVASNAVRTLGIKRAGRYARVTGMVFIVVGIGFYFLLNFIIP